MCTTCGCGTDHAHELHDDHHGDHHHHRGDHHPHGPADPRSGQRSGPAPDHEPATGGSEESARQARLLRIEQDILGRNNAIAAGNRSAFAAAGVFAFNLVSAPGSGKTTLLAETIGRLRGRAEIAVIEGDPQTEIDAERIREAGARAVQINTGKGCHLDAAMIARALATLRPAAGSIVAIENVGNLVCPSAFDLGEAARVVLASVTEGDDKPLKYPEIFRGASLMLIGKTDLLPHLDFDAVRCADLARRVSPGIEVIRVSARSGDGMDLWLDWLLRGLRRAHAGNGVAAAALTTPG